MTKSNLLSIALNIEAHSIKRCWTGASIQSGVCGSGENDTTLDGYIYGLSAVADIQ
jgi:hypothetical protein